MRRLFRCKCRRHRRSYEGRSAYSIGLRVGYWPCLKAPFVQISALFWVIELWHGYADKEMFARGDA
jgi:hypothetical protein